MLGVVYYQTNRAEVAVQLISQALAINPKQIDYLNHYGLALREAHQVEAAIKNFQQAIIDCLFIIFLELVGIHVCA